MPLKGGLAMNIKYEPKRKGEGIDFKPPLDVGYD